MSVVALGDRKRMLFAIFCCALLMLLTAPMSAAREADPSNAPTIGKSALLVGSTTGCGVLITITGTSGHLVATIAGSGTASGNPYDGDEDELVGVQNNSSVTLGALRLSAPPNESSPTNNLFAFDGDGPCNYASENNGNNKDCFAGNPPLSDSHDYEVNNIFTASAPTIRQGRSALLSPFPFTGVRGLVVENTPAAVVSIGETQPLVTRTTDLFPFGPSKQSCGIGLAMIATSLDSPTWRRSPTGIGNDNLVFVENCKKRNCGLSLYPHSPAAVMVSSPGT
jgi:hypothetical protein